MQRADIERLSQVGHLRVRCSIVLVYSASRNEHGSFPSEQNGGQSRKIGICLYSCKPGGVTTHALIHIENEQVERLRLQTGSMIKGTGFNDVHTTILQTKSNQPAK